MLLIGQMRRGSSCVTHVLSLVVGRRARAPLGSHLSRMSGAASHTWSAGSHSPCCALSLPPPALRRSASKCDPLPREPSSVGLAAAAIWLSLSGAEMGVHKSMVVHKSRCAQTWPLTPAQGTQAAASAGSRADTNGVPTDDGQREAGCTLEHQEDHTGAFEGAFGPSIAASKRRGIRRMESGGLAFRLSSDDCHKDDMVGARTRWVREVMSRRRSRGIPPLDASRLSATERQSERMSRWAHQR